MNYIAVRCVELSLILGLCLSASGQDLPAKHRPAGVTGHKNSPVPEEALLKLRDEGRTPEMRQHAWQLFARLTGQTPVWETWYTKCDVNLSVQECPEWKDRLNNRHRLFRNFDVPIQVLNEFSRLNDPDLRNGTSDDKLADFLAKFKRAPQVASVLYNPSAAQHILGEQLYKKKTLDDIRDERRLHRSPEDEWEIAPFPRDSIVIKTAWQVVDVVNHDYRVYIWDPKVLKDRRAAGNYDALSFTSSWGNFVTIDLTPGRLCSSDSYPDRSSVPIDCFYHFKIKDERDVAAFPASVGQIVGPSGRAIQPENYLVLVAMHVTTREIPNWVWATFWWSNQAREPGYGDGRPPEITGKWRHFLMDTTLSGVTPRDSLDQGNKICFNPYLEEIFENGIASNCIQCHQRAVYPPKPGGYNLGLLGRDGETPARGAKPNPTYFSDAIKLDFIWSLNSPHDEKQLRLLKSFVQALE